MNKKLIIAIIGILVLVVAALIWNWKFKVTAEAREFVGKVEKIEGSTIYAKGAFVVPDKPEFSGSDYIRDVKISITPETKFTKTLVFLPSAKELEKTGGYFDGSKLPRENRDASPEMMKNELNSRNIVIEAKANKNIFQKSEFSVVEVKYTVQFVEEIDGLK